MVVGVVRVALLVFFGGTEVAVGAAPELGEGVAPPEPPWDAAAVARANRSAEQSLGGIHCHISLFDLIGGFQFQYN